MTNMTNANLNDTTVPDDTALVIGGLVNAADSLTKKVISAYRYDVVYQKNLAILRTFDCKHLEAAAVFLGGNPGSKADKTKRYQNRTTLADWLIMRLESLFPCECEGCNEKYCVKLGVNPPVRCFLCNQGSHDCEAMSGSVGTKPGSTWLCKPCRDKNNRIEPFDTETSTDDADQSDAEFEVKISPKTGRSGKKTTKTKKRKSNGGKEDQPNQEDDMVTPVGGVQVLTNISTGENVSEQVVEELDNKISKPANKFKNVCERYLLRDCPHGAKGDKLIDGNSCRKEHPKMCMRFSQYGTTRNHGCNKGNQCPYIHPPLCKDSELTRVCTNLDCKKTHLKFTRRAEDKSFAQSAPTKAEKAVADTPSSRESSKKVKKKKKSGQGKNAMVADPSPPTLTDTRTMEDFLIVMMGSLRDDIFQKMNLLDKKVDQVNVKVDMSLDSIREEFRGYTPPRPVSLPLTKPEAGTPMTFDVEGALKRFRNFSALTPGV